MRQQIQKAGFLGIAVILVFTAVFSAVDTIDSKWKAFVDSRRSAIFTLQACTASIRRRQTAAGESK